MTAASDSPDRWQRLWDLFHAALEREPSARSAFLDEAVGDDAALRREIDELLAAHASDAVLDKPVSPEHTPSSTFTAGDQLAGRFRIVRLLGSGGMGTVYEAVDEELGTPVAIKMLHAEMARNTEALDRFRREVLLARRVTDRNACRLFDLFHHQDGTQSVAFVTMELLRGKTLAERLARTGPLSEREAQPIVEQIAAALVAAHRVGIVHRDLKSANVVLVPAGNGEPERTVVTDFGLAAIADAASTSRAGITRTGQLLGTPEFMAPEQLEGQPATFATDIYALGLLMFQMVTGEIPFGRESALTLALKRLREPPPAPNSLRPNLRPEWNAAILRCLERNPADRFQSAQAVVDAVRSPSSIARIFIPARTRRRLMMGAAAAGIIIALAAGVVMLRGDVATPAATTLAFNERDWVLVADFDNRTGDALLDDTVRFALERELNTSRFVNVVPRERVADALRLMKRPEDTDVSGDVAREVCLRDGAIRALIRGRIDKLGVSYVLAVEVVQPTSGVVVASVAEEARGQDDVLRAVLQLSNKLRTTFGEKLALVASGNQKLVHVTTSSLRALQLYSQADAVIARSTGDPAAEELLRQAIAEDPEFASAYIHLAHAIRNQRRAPADFLPYASRALELVSTVDEAEQQFIRGSYYDMTGDFERALAAYRALVQLQPDHFWANNNAGALLSLRLLRGEEAIPYSLRAADLRPNDFVANHRAVWNVAVRGNSPAAARKPIERAHSLLAAGFPALPGPRAWVQVFPALDQWLSGDAAGALERLRTLEHSIASDAAGQALRVEIDYAYQALGRFNDAERLMDSPVGATSRLVQAFLRDDRDGVREWVNAQGRGMLTNLGVLGPSVLAHLGMVDAAQTGIARLERQPPASPGAFLPNFDTVPILRGEVAWAKGNIGEAIALIEQRLPAERLTGSPIYFLASQTLAAAWLRQGNLNRAMSVLEDAHRQKGRIVQGSGAFWLRTTWQLAKLYRQVGRPAAADAIEVELRQMLSVADRDHPILVAMTASSVPTP